MTTEETSFAGYLNTTIQQVDGLLDSFFQRKINEAQMPMVGDMYRFLHEYCRRDGKRIRPILLMLGYEGYRGLINRQNEILKLALALELMHSFLLIQDDIIDKSELRRGGKALHLLTQDHFKNMTHTSTIGADVALVLGDVLFTNALELISDAAISRKVKEEYMNIFFKTYEKTAWGQIMDTVYSLPKKLSMDPELPLQISSMKTAYYTIYYPLLMGHVLSGRRNGEEEKAIEEFALPLGLAFQLRDDLLGVFARSSEIGKSSDSDIEEGKATLLVYETLERLKGEEKRRFSSAFTKQKKNARDIAFIRKAMETSGARESVVATQRQYIHDARHALDRLRLRDRVRVRLHGLVDMLDDR